MKQIDMNMIIISTVRMVSVCFTVCACVHASMYLNACMDDQSMKTKQMDMCHPLEKHCFK